MSCQGLKDLDMIVIGRHKNWETIQYLFLDENQIGVKGAVTIGSNSTWIKLKTLVLSGNPICDKGAVAIGSNTIWTDLEALLFLREIK